MEISFQSDNRIFTLFCLLNKIGYDAENNLKMHALRQKVRRGLSKSETDLNKFKVLAGKYHQSQILEAFLHFSRFPNFVQKEKKWQTTLPKSIFIKTTPEIKKFFRTNNILKLYQNNKSSYNNIILLSQSIKNDLRAVMTLLKIKTPIKQIILMPNFLDAYWRGYGPIINKTQYIIFGHCKTKNKFEFLIRHEFLHNLVNPLFDPRIKKIARIVQPQIKLTDKFKKQSYQQTTTATNEYIVRALNIIYQEKQFHKDINELIDNEKQKGFILIETTIIAIKNALPYLK
ncbi:MAG: DUF4932 domain-containing protein [Candidatus Parcubacteria bacterium]|nr:DUF4932 domain-containing protein [Candidatus Parcubacteria bacterium]